MIVLRLMYMNDINKKIRQIEEDIDISDDEIVSNEDDLDDDEEDEDDEDSDEAFNRRWYGE